MTQHDCANDIQKLSDFMLELNKHSDNLKEHLLNGTIIRHKAYAIKRDRDVFTPVRYDADLNAIKSLFQILSGNPLSTKEAELFPGFIQVKSSSYTTTMELTDLVNYARLNIKNFLISRKKNTCITTASGVVYTQNPLMFRHYPMVNTMQIYRQLSSIYTNTNKSSFIWQSNKRYLKHDLAKASNILKNAKLSPIPLNVDPKEWLRDIELALEKIERLPLDIEITKICSTEPKPHFKFKPVKEKVWTSHYGGTSLIIANKDDHLFSVDKKMQSIDVTNKHKNLPVGGQWTPLCKSLNLYYQR
ncbi:MAG: hypothetical protein ACI87J_002324 [Colwellia sp.]|jgi:hypothetical protein